MSVATVLVVAALIVGGVYAWIFGSLVTDAYFRYRGPRVVRCPDSGEAAVVEFDAMRAAVSSLGSPTLRVRRCAHWPERAGCDQACLCGIDASAARDHGLLVRTLRRRVRAPLPAAGDERS